MARTKKIPHCAVIFEASEQKRIANESLYWDVQVKDLFYGNFVLDINVTGTHVLGPDGK